ncbi:MAG: response regulator, partial [Candidatus Sumerlaeota bacterium]|nr:response regulator [Candidatus Sumerlaeota bacterium]
LYVYLGVRDTGCGIDKQIQARIFDPFFTTKFPGRGLGLAAVLGIVRGHRGAIKVYSEPGKGTTFKVLFPAATSPAERLEKQTERRTAWRGSGTILLVDDEETVRALGKKMLERLGFDVLTASDGREALQVYAARRDDIVCVMLDLTMPHLDGDATFRALRRIRQDVKVIMTSGYNEEEVTQRFMGRGLMGFLQKPYQLSALMSRMRECLEGGGPPTSA